MGSDVSYKVLEPIRLRGLELRNRFAFVPFETNYAQVGSYPGTKHLEFYRKVAAGGVGLIILEATNVNPTVIATKYGMSIARDEYIPYFERLVDAVHAEGGRILLQLVDKSVLNQGKTVADLSKEEIAMLSAHFIKATARVAKAGFDGVEYHMAHLYTLADFLSRDGNVRRDEYGGSVVRRMRLARDIFERAKANADDAFIFATRFNGDDFLVGGNTTRDAVQIAVEFEKMGFDLLDISVGGRIEKILKDGRYGGWQQSYSAQRCIPSATYGDACNIHIAATIKAAVGKALVVGCGKIGDFKLANSVVEDGSVDLVGLSRAFFCDPEFVNKSVQGREIISCTWCNVCHRNYVRDEEVTCPRRERYERRHAPAVAHDSTVD